MIKCFTIHEPFCFLLLCAPAYLIACRVLVRASSSSSSSPSSLLLWSLCHQYY